MIIKVNAKTQQLILLENEVPLKHYTIATSSRGLGEERGSQMTPRGWHQIRAKIGQGTPINTVFIKRRPTGELYSKEIAQQFPDRDWILTRILWLSGLEKGLNRFGKVDTMRRYIYIHGCPDHCPLGVPLSHGCIRMNNQDIIELFELVPVQTRVLITA